MSTKLQTVHVRVNDAQTGQPTPVRIRFTDAAGNYYAPFGRLTEFATGVNQDVGGNLQLGKAKYAVIVGTCEIALPPGPITIDIKKGFEYRPLHQEIHLGPGQLSLRFNLVRWLDLRNEGWYSGDGRAHFLSPQAALLEGAAEDLAIVNLLALHWQPQAAEPALPNLLAFSGQQASLESSGHIVAVNTLNTSALGNLALLNCHRVVYPLHFERINWTVADWCGQCHRKAGLVAWPEHDSWPMLREDDFVSEGLIDLILGKVDVLEVDLLPWTAEDALDWYTLLNAGLRIPLLGASRKKTNTTVLGCVRTYAHLSEPGAFTYKSWIEAVRAGRTFVTNGPILDFTINGHGPGSTVEVPAETKTIHVRAHARSLVPFQRLEVIQNGAVVTEQKVADTPAETILDVELPISESGWWAARCWGDHHVQTSICPQPASAHTSPTYVRLGEKPMIPQSEAIQDVLDHCDRFGQMLDRLDRQGRFAGEADRQRLAGLLDEARAVLQAKLKGI
ncbi:MAG TPA: CehA/McbA family metallohydrolase [Gemmataceae bacterium]|nr:CehA/McbA family metallohydrolase [Gemmataceae bacterium]